jgi:exopolysaccharide biosynthesis predicted pyruvyltransferase EpsI
MIESTEQKIKLHQYSYIVVDELQQIQSSSNHHDVTSNDIYKSDSEDDDEYYIEEYIQGIGETNTERTYERTIISKSEDRISEGIPSRNDIIATISRDEGEILGISNSARKQVSTSNEEPDPFRSTPPDSIPLEEFLDDPIQTNDPSEEYDTTSFFFRRMTQNRHECIRRIRKRQFKVLAPYVKPALASAKNSSDLLLIDPSYHANVGDSMLTLGEIEFIRRLQSNYKYQQIPLDQCSYEQAKNYVEPCHEKLESFSKQRDNSSSDDRGTTLAMWHAGGNWGNLWKTIQKIRVKSYQEILLAGYDRIISMPQSLYYSAELGKHDKPSDSSVFANSIAVAYGLLPSNQTDLSKNARSLLQNSEIRTAVKDRVVLTWRERSSHFKARNIYPFATNVLVPDIAFQLGPYNGTRQNIYSNPLSDPSTPISHPEQHSFLHPNTTDVVLFLREDYESVYTKYRNRDSIINILKETAAPKDQNLSFIIVDWDDRLALFETNDIFFTDTAIRLLSLGKVVIADRLHAAILSYLSGIPFIYLDNVSGKINQTLQVAFEQWDGCHNNEHAMYSRAPNLPEAISLAISFIDKYHL